MVTARKPSSARQRAALASASGDAVAWGDDQYNELGDLPCCVGYGAAKSLPQAVPVPPDVTQLAAGLRLFEAVHGDGSVSAWGYSTNGATGLGANNGYAVYAAAQVPISGVISVAAGSNHTLFLTTDGLYATGMDDGGSLGRGPFCCGYFTTPVPSTAIPDAVAIATSFSTSYALRSDATVVAFGSNAQGQFGRGDTDQSEDNPVQVPGLTNVVAISASMFAGYALKADGTVWSWGSNYDGGLGNGSLTDGVSGPTKVVGLSDIVALGSGPNSTSGYAIKSGGSVWAWGSNNTGQLGNGTTTPSGTPVQIPGLSQVTQVSASSSTAMALTSDQKAWSWGENTYGQLGDGNHATQLTPTRILELPGAVAVAAGPLAGAASANIPTPGPLPTYYGPGDGLNPSGLADPCRQCLNGDPVNTATGALVDDFKDLAIPGRGVPLDLSRNYSSALASRDGPFGRGWSWSYGLSLAEEVATGVVTVTQENASQVQFAPDGAGGYSVPPFMAASLKHNADGTWTMTRRARLRLTFDAQGRLARQTDRNGYATMFTYPSAVQQVITEPAGRKITLTIAGGHITKAADSATPSRQVLYGYTNGDLTSVTDVAGGVTSFGYDADHRMTTVRQPKYFGDTTTTPTPVTTHHYDGNGRVDLQTDPLGRQTTYDYTTVAGATMITDPKGNVVLVRYTNGRRTSSTRGYGTASAATSRYFYDPDSSALTASCDALESCTTSTYDSAGNVLTTRDPMGRKTTNTYDALNNVKSTTDPAGTTTTLTYDGAGNLLTRSRPLRNSSGATIATQTTTYNYGGTTPVFAGDVTSIVDPRGKTVLYRYDAFGNKLSQTAPATPENAAGNKTTHSYDTGTGWLTSTTTPRGNLAGATPAQHTTTYTRDAFGRVTQAKDPLWTSSAPLLHQLTTHYDANGNTAFEIGASANKTIYTYSAANQLTKTSRPDGTSTSKSYHADGTLSEYSSGRSLGTSYTYNPLGHVTSIEDGAGRVTSYQPDAVGNVIWKGAPGSDCTSDFAGCAKSTYNASRQLLSRTFYDGTPSITNIRYDANGRQTTMTDATGVSTWAYDSLDRMISSKDGNGDTVSYGYDISNHQTSITYPGSLKVTHNFDAAGRIDWIQDYKANKTTFAYNANSALLKTTRPAAAGVTDTLTYDNIGRQLTTTMAKGTTTLAKFTYTRDGASRLLTDTTTGISDPAHAYGYDALERLTKSGTAASPIVHAYDADSDLVSRTSAATLAYDDAGQPCWRSPTAVLAPTCLNRPADATGYTFDSRGNRTAATPPTGTATSFGYDAQNNLKSFGTTATYKSDGTGLRLSKKVGTTTQKLVWDRSSGVPRLLSDGTNRYVYGPDGSPLEQITSAGVVTHLHHDQLGSTRLLTSAAGANTGSYSFDAFGATTAKTGSATTPLQYAGQYNDSESGLIYMRARSYDPTTGQFISRDPLEGVTREPYLYASGDPINRIDPLGQLSNPLDWDITSDISDYAAAFGDRFTGAGKQLAEAGLYQFTGLRVDIPGTTYDYREWLGVNDAVDFCSNSYRNGGWTAEAAMMLPGGAGLARGGLRWIWKTRGRPGPDGGISKIGIEYLGDDAISQAHRVTVNGKVVHQHQRHLGKAGGQRDFPDEWVEFPRINAP